MKRFLLLIDITIALGFFAAAAYILLTLFLTLKPAAAEFLPVSAPDHLNPDQTRFLGLWVNENPQTRSIPQIHISTLGSQIVVHAWGSCHPDWCDWGKAAGQFTDAATLQAFWDQDFADAQMTLKLLPSSKLELTFSKHFKDNSGRQDYSITEIYARAARPTVTPASLK